jgi:REP element-mobilizing transposase RayT
MARTARVVVAETPRHFAQRGNRRQRALFRPAGHAVCIDLEAKAFAATGVEAWAYCLMPNQVHLIATPRTLKSLSAAVGPTHVRYTRQINQREGWDSHLWRGVSPPVPWMRIIRALDQQDRRLARLERDVGIGVETMALFVRFWLTTTPSLPEPAAQAARAKAGARYDRFVTAFGRRLNQGPKLRQENPEDIPAEQNSHASGAS